jgi:uncharacterized DUF497 family protein
MTPTLEYPIQSGSLPSQFIVDTIKQLQVTFDPAKDAENVKKHGISLARAKDSDFDTAWYLDDDSQDYGEIRVIAISWLDALLYTLIFRDEDASDTIRAISLRKATEHERNQYAQN